MKTFGEKLKQAMQKLHLNQIQVSGLTGTSVLKTTSETLLRAFSF